MNLIELRPRHCGNSLQKARPRLKMFSSSRLLRFFTPRNQGLTFADLEDMDVSVEMPLTINEEEKFEVKDGELTATTGTINGADIIQTNGKYLEGYVHPDSTYLTQAYRQSLMTIKILSSRRQKQQVSSSWSHGIPMVALHRISRQLFSSPRTFF